MKINRIYRAKLTQKGQITLLKEIRDTLDLDYHDVVTMELSGKNLILKKAPSFFDLAGKLKPKKNIGVDPLKAREYMETHYERV